MTIIVAYKTEEDGVVLGTDSALTMMSADRTSRLHDFGNCKKLFSLGTKSIGIATYGKCYFGGRPIKYHMNEFIKNRAPFLRKEVNIADVVEKLREYFSPIYEKDVMNRTTKNGTPLSETDDGQFGMVIGGFSDGAKATDSEVWNLHFPKHLMPGSSEQVVKFPAYYGVRDPIFRYETGISEELYDALDGYIQGPMNNAADVLFDIALRHPYKPKQMKMDDAIEYTKFLIELTKGRYQYYEDEPNMAVGGEIVIGVAKPNGRPFEILNSNQTSPQLPLSKRVEILELYLLFEKLFMNLLESIYTKH